MSNENTNTTRPMTEEEAREELGKIYDDLHEGMDPETGLLPNEALELQIAEDKLDEAKFAIEKLELRIAVARLRGRERLRGQRRCHS